MTLLNELGNYAPFILVAWSWQLLWGHSNLFFYFNVGLFFNAVLNLLLKGFIQEPRPMFDSKKIKLMASHASHFFFQNGIPFDIYGMPSGHSQAVFFMTTFIYLSLKHTGVLYAYLLFSLLVCSQRVGFHYHTVAQVVVGAIAGIGVATMVYRLAREKIKGHVHERADDNGPV